MRLRLPSSLALSIVGLLVSTGAARATDWPTLMQNAGRTGYVPDPGISAASAAHLGVRWMTNLYSADLGSVVAAYDPQLGKTLVYVGDENGELRALDEKDGSTIWSTSLGPGAALRDTPLVFKGAVWVGTSYGARVVKLDASTGQILCSVPGPASFFASPLGVSVGGTQMVYASTIDEPAFSGPLDGIDATSCSTTFAFEDYATQTGPWASPAFATDALGRNVVIFGTADPDSREYSIDALTGQRYWVHAIANPPPGTYDIGAAADIAPVGTNGFADGVAYFPTKYGIMTALDLTTGKPYWSFNFNKAAHATEGGLSTPARIGNEIVFGYNGGAYALNATTGSVIWQWVDPYGMEVLASPAIVGPAGREVVALADLGGAVRVLQLASGQQLYSYQTHGYVDGSVAYMNGHFIDASSDGFVYDFGLGGGNDGAPKTSLVYPPTNAKVGFDGGSVTIRGTAYDAHGIASVQVGVQYGGSAGPWYDAATGGWSSGAVSNPATLTYGGSRNVAKWQVQVPIPLQGGAFSVLANAVDDAHIADVTGVRSSFVAHASRHAATIAASPANVPPGGVVTLSGAGFAANEDVVVNLGGTANFSTAASATGTVGPQNLTVPLASTFGTTQITATGQSSGATASTTIDVANVWAQLGYDTERTSFEPNDHAFSHVVHIGPDLYLTQAWYATAYAPIESSPAVAGGVAYFGNDAGTMNAVATQNSSPVWSYEIPSGAAIRSSPAVDSGLVIFGADDGVLYEVASSRGALAGTVALGGRLTSPAVTGGVIYVASRGGELHAVDEFTQTVLWSVAGGATTAASPAVDPAQGLVIACDDSGHVSAYTAATGARVWRTFTGGGLKASPLIDKGIVYAGSTNGTLYALEEKTGQIAWTFAEGSPIDATPAIARGDTFFGFKGDSIFVGSDDGTISALDSATKKLVWHIDFGSSVVSLSATLGDLVFFELANGQIGATRSPEFSDHLWSFQTGGSLDTSPVILDGTLYVGAGDGGVYAFTPFGDAPDARVRALSSATRAMAVPMRAALGNPQARAFPIRIASAPVAGSTSPLRSHGGPVQTAPRTYAIFWLPAGSDAESTYAASIEKMLSARPKPAFAGAVVDTSPMPAVPTDATMIDEIERVARRAGWNADTNAQFVLLPARAAFGPVPGFCAYHSAAEGPRGPFAYAIVPYPAGASGCGSVAGLGPSGDADADRALPSILREQADVASDPFLSGLYDASGHEAGDFTGSVR